MKDELTELQKIWQKYPGKNKRSGEVLDDIKKLDRKEKVQNLIRTGVFILTILFLVFIFYKFHFVSTVANIGFAILCFSIVIYASIMWWIQNIRYEQKIIRPLKYVLEPAIRKLTLKKYFTRYFLPALAFDLALGINLIYLEIFSTFGILFRLIIHSLVTILLLIVFYLGWLKNLKRIRKVTDPLLSKIKKEHKTLTLEL